MERAIFYLMGIGFVAAGVCQKETNTTIFSDPTNCSQFIQCQANQEVIMRCQEHLEFNPNINACDYPEYIKPPKGYCEYPDIIYEKAHFCDCNKYILCNNGVPYVMSCSPKPFLEKLAHPSFNLKSDVCDRCK